MAAKWPPVFVKLRAHSLLLTAPISLSSYIYAIKHKYHQNQIISNKVAGFQIKADYLLFFAVP